MQPKIRQPLGFLFLVFTLLLPVNASAQHTPPPKAVLSGDLTSPWLLQLKNRKDYQARNQQIQRRSASVERSTMRSGIFAARPNSVTVQPFNRKQGQNLQQVLFQRPPAPARPAPTANPNQRAKGEIDPKYQPQRVAFYTGEKPGTIIIDTSQRFLYLVQADGIARRYGVGVGREGFEWSGTNKISRKAEWPDWRPPAEMRERERKKGKNLPVVMAGGPGNPLGARALYLGDTLYRIHGTNQPHTIGMAVSSGCIRMRNEDVMDLYERVGVGTKVIVR